MICCDRTSAVQSLEIVSNAFGISKFRVALIKAQIRVQDLWGIDQWLVMFVARVRLQSADRAAERSSALFVFLRTKRKATTTPGVRDHITNIRHTKSSRAGLGSLETSPERRGCLSVAKL
jgi:hypothetical protein